MTEPARFLPLTAAMLLRITLEKLATQQPGTEHYSARVYQALLMAHDAGFKTGVAIEFTDGGAHVVIAVIQLPTDIITFRMPFFLGTIEGHTAETRTKAIKSYLSDDPLRKIFPPKQD